MTDRILSQNITPTTHTPFMTTYAARVTQQLNVMLASEELFLSVRGFLRAGDEVRLCRYEHGDWDKARILEYVTLLITQSTPTAVEFEPIGDIRVIGAAKPELEPKPEVKQIPNLTIVENEGGGYLVQDETGYTQKHFKSHDAAQKYVAAYSPKSEVK